MNLHLTIPVEIFEQIERYLLQQMTDDESNAFEQQLQSDTQLQDRVQQLQLLITGVQEASLISRLNSFHQEMPVAQIPIKTRNTIALKRWLVAASIFLLIGLGGWWLLFHQSKNEKLYAAYFRRDPGLVTAMSSTDNYVFEKAMVEYKTGNYPQAISTWKSLAQSGATSDTLNYFIGSALLVNKNPQEAITYLQKVTAIKNSYFLTDAYWYIGLSFIQLNRLQEAVTFIQQSGRPEADALLEQLKQ